MTDVIATVQREHRALAAVLHCFDHVLSDIRERKIVPDFALFDAIIDYVQDFPDRFHHPKEDEVLFPLLLKDAPELKDTVAALQAEHHDGLRLTSDLRWKLDKWRNAPVEGFAEFEGTARKFIDWQRKHIANEERNIIPVARAKLSPQSRTAADAAFAANDDPIFGDNPKRVYDRLLSRIAALAPQPWGYAERKAPPPPEPDAPISPEMRRNLVNLHWI